MTALLKAQILSHPIRFVFLEAPIDRMNAYGASSRLVPLCRAGSERLPSEEEGGRP